MKEGCLHCELIKAARKWLKSHSAPDAQITEMIGRFTAEAVASLHSHKDQGVEVLIFGTKYSNEPRGRLH